MKARIALLAGYALTAWLLFAAPAIASDNGEGLLGETDDKVITFFSLGVVIFFAVLVTVLSWLQSTLDKRKEQRKATKVRDIVGW
jgi:membrane protease YdiL (CAAX protease family)